MLWKLLEQNTSACLSPVTFQNDEMKHWVISSVWPSSSGDLGDGLAHSRCMMRWSESQVRFEIAAISKLIDTLFE